MVQRAIDSVATASYPGDRLEIIVVDDGSTDDTWSHIERAAARHPGVVTTLRFPRTAASERRSPPASSARAARSRSQSTPTASSRRTRCSRWPAASATQCRHGRGQGPRLQPARGDHPADAPRPLHSLVRPAARGAVDLPHGLLRPRRAGGLPGFRRAPGAVDVARAVLPRREVHLRRGPRPHELHPLRRVRQPLPAFRRRAHGRADDVRRSLQDVHPLGAELHPRGDPLRPHPLEAPVPSRVCCPPSTRS